MPPTLFLHPPLPSLPPNLPFFSFSSHFLFPFFFSPLPFCSSSSIFFSSFFFFLFFLFLSLLSSYLLSSSSSHFPSYPPLLFSPLFIPFSFPPFLPPLLLFSLPDLLTSPIVGIAAHTKQWDEHVTRVMIMWSVACKCIFQGHRNHSWRSDVIFY